MAMETSGEPSRPQRQGREFWALALELQSESAIDTDHPGETMDSGCLEKSASHRERVRLCAADIIIRTSCRHIIRTPKLRGRRGSKNGCHPCIFSRLSINNVMSTNSAFIIINQLAIKMHLVLDSVALYS